MGNANHTHPEQTLIVFSKNENCAHGKSCLQCRDEFRKSVIELKRIENENENQEQQRAHSTENCEKQQMNRLFSSTKASRIQ